MRYATARVGAGMQIKSVVDYIIKGTVGLLLAVCTALATWVWQAEARIGHLDSTVGTLTKDIARLQAQDATLQALQTDLAVVKSQQQSTVKQLDRIEALLVR